MTHHDFRVMVLDKGEIIEFASPQELLNNKSSVFASMVENAGLGKKESRSKPENN